MLSAVGWLLENWLGLAVVPVGHGDLLNREEEFLTREQASLA